MWKYVVAGAPNHQQQICPILGLQVRRSSSFCLGNLVKDNPANAAALVAGGGVELLLLCLNDEEVLLCIVDVCTPSLLAASHPNTPDVELLLLCLNDEEV